ncbi:hypothetical protein [Geoglobus acetivorans]
MREELGAIKNAILEVAKKHEVGVEKKRSLMNTRYINFRLQC